MIRKEFLARVKNNNLKIERIDHRQRIDETSTQD